MPNIKLTIAYDGTSYLGWQKTPLGPSIEASLEKALSSILQEKVNLQAASRTDAGVHAKGQVVNFLTEKEVNLPRLQRSLNFMLGGTIAILQIEKASENFHPTLDNIGKEYHYFICNSAMQLPKYRYFSWHYPHPLDIKAMQSAAVFLLGTHDFASFCNEHSSFTRSTICTLKEIEFLFLEKDRFLIKVFGDRFLFRMVRNLVGTLVYVGCGKLKLDQIGNILQKKQRSHAGVTAPSHGLHLVNVFF